MKTPRKVVACAAIALTVLSGCSGSVKREDVDDVPCVIGRDSDGMPTAIDCNWNSGK